MPNIARSDRSNAYILFLKIHDSADTQDRYTLWHKFCFPLPAWVVGKTLPLGLSAHHAIPLSDPPATAFFTPPHFHHPAGIDYLSNRIFLGLS